MGAKWNDETTRIVASEREREGKDTTHTIE